MNFIEIDYQVLKFFNGLLWPYLDLIFLFIVYSAYIFLAFLAYCFFKTRNRSKLVHLIVTCVIGYLVVLGLKFSIDRPRPCITYNDIVCVLIRADPSFPSAHAFISFLSLHFISKSTFKKFRLPVYFYLAFLIPVGSLYVGVHFPSDIIAGAIMGMLFPILIPEKFSNKFLSRFI